MTREELHSLSIESIDCNKGLILELPTGTGKSKLAIDLVNHICDRVFNNHEQPTEILIVVAKRVHKQNWLDEIDKWGGIKSDYITIECYESLKKYRNHRFDVVVLDEAHHINSDTRLELLKSLIIEENLILLSATLPLSLKLWMKRHYRLNTIKCSLQNAIDSDILPEPTIYLLPLEFDNIVSEEIVKNGGKKLPILNCVYNERWTYIKSKNREIHIKCTKRQYLEDLNSQIEWYKKKYMNSRNIRIKNCWLRLCNDRLKWLSNLKNEYIQDILRLLDTERTITFCNSIEQTEILGKNCIHSKNKEAENTYLAFNREEIDHITSCQMLNEGMNISNCRVGIYANINASETITKQRMGRLLRHKEPIVIIPFYKHTREHELVNKMLEEYDTKLIKTITNIKEIKL